MRSLGFKLLLAFVAVSLAGTALLGIAASRAIDIQFGAFVNSQRAENMAAELSAYYESNGSWDGVASLVMPGGQGAGFGGGRGSGNQGGTGGGFALAGPGGLILASTTGETGQTAAAGELAAGVPVVVDGQQVGTLLMRHSGAQPLNAAAQAILTRLKNALVLAGLAATVLAAVLAAWLARTLTRPLGELTEAASAVSAGELTRSVSVRSGDEVGRLAQAFNAMTAQLARAQEARRQMTADIAHELRTPLTVILGQSEAMREGVLPASPHNLEIVHEEAQRLSRMVEDLRTLSLAEAGELKLQLRDVRVEPLLERALDRVRALAAEKSIALDLQVDEGLPSLNLDPDRMEQVLGNLLANALRHTPQGGRIGLSARKARGGVRIEVSDSGPGIAAEDLERVFERFYRADKARQRDRGGAGLGLAISRSIVQAHGGRIWAESPPGQGAHFYVEMYAG